MCEETQFKNFCSSLECLIDLENFEKIDDLQNYTHVELKIDLEKIKSVNPDFSQDENLNKKSSKNTKKKHCIHGKYKYYCRECGGNGYCIHNKMKTFCVECGGSSICIHKKNKYICKECGGKLFCVHRINKYKCVLCNSSSISVHTIKKKYCIKCEHDKIKKYCSECKKNI